jgi:hypothetical protein
MMCIMGMGYLEVVALGQSTRDDSIAGILDLFFFDNVVTCLAAISLSSQFGFRASIGVISGRRSWHTVAGVVLVTEGICAIFAETVHSTFGEAVIFETGCWPATVAFSACWMGVYSWASTFISLRFVNHRVLHLWGHLWVCGRVIAGGWRGGINYDGRVWWWVDTLAWQ